MEYHQNKEKMGKVKRKNIPVIIKPFHIRYGKSKSRGKRTVYDIFTSTTQAIPSVVLWMRSNRKFVIDPSGDEQRISRAMGLLSSS